MRVFAGPNGSGKSSIINEVKNAKVKGKPVDFGIYVNADDIAKDLRNNTFSFASYALKVTPSEFRDIALTSGLVNDDFTKAKFSGSYSLSNNKLKLKNKNADERLAQIVADFLRKRLIGERKKFSFETVFSHSSKLDIMKEAKEAGYKVYLYFVSTESPDINKYRVEVRVKNNGHDVNPEKIEQRYYRSLDLLYEAAQLAYQAYFIDNSTDDLKDGAKSASWLRTSKL